MSQMRASQSLQVAVIVFALLTVVMSATTFVVFKGQEDAELRAAMAQQAAQAAEQGLRSAIEENQELRRLMGAAQSESLDTVRAVHQKAMSLYAVNVPESDRNLLAALAYNYTAMQTARREQVEDRNKLQELSEKVAVLEANKDATLARHRQEAIQAMTELTNRTLAFAELQKKLFGEKTVLSNLVTRLNDVVATLTEELKKQIAACKQRSGELINQRDEAISQVRKLRDAVLESPPDGRIIHVDVAARRAWINLGQADGLRSLMEFGVWDAAAAVPKSRAKGRLEILTVGRDHVAVARIVEDSPLNPLVAGDQVSTPLWNPGERLHFAICGQVDLDSDGQPDMQLLRNWIAAAGGEIDAQLQVSGAIEGSMNIDTRFLIVGRPWQGREQAFSEMHKQAKEFGVEPIGAAELLSKLGRRATSPLPGTSRTESAPLARADVFRRRAPASAPVASAY